MAARRPSAKLRRRRLPDAAFLNVPYDAQHEELFLAFLAGLSGFALIPHATLEIPGSQRRLDRIFRLLRRCCYSFHDLSRVELDPRRRLPRGSTCHSNSVSPWRSRRCSGLGTNGSCSRHAINLCDMQAKYADVVPVEEVKRYLAALPKGLFDLPRGVPRPA